jgi:cytochrome P450
VDQLHELEFPLAWTVSHGGYWVLGSWSEGKRVLENWQPFSSDNDIHQHRRGGLGVAIPRQPYPLVLSESDPPLSTERRRLEMPFFTPKALQKWTPVAQKHLDEALDAVMGQDSADLVHDIVIPTTARTTLHILGFDPDNWKDAALSAHRSSFTKAGDPDYPIEELTRLRTMFQEMLNERRANSKNDLISALAHGTVRGVPLTNEEGESMMSALVFGGFDTTTSAVVHALIWLADHRQHHRELIDNPDHLSNAVEEFLRFFPPTPGVARTVMEDTRIGGLRIAKGERIYTWFNAANRDPAKFEFPLELRLDRHNARDHLSFSAGGHRCLGSVLAKLEIAIMVRTLLQRVPNCHIDLDAVIRYPSYGSIFGYSKVPLRFGAGRVGRLVDSAARQAHV